MSQTAGELEGIDALPPEAERVARPFVERTLVHLGVRDHVARLLVATPSLHLSWFAAAAAALGFAVLAAVQRPDGLLFFLVLAPLLPVAGVAFAFGPHADPAYDLAQAAPTSSLRLLLLRTTAVLAVTFALTGIGAVLVPRLEWTSAAWILPSLALTLTTIALSTVISELWAAGLVVFLWFAAIIVSETFSETRFAAFRGPGQIAFFAILVGSSAVLAWRRNRVEQEGRATQQRIVDARVAERRRIERNIHDGAQQQLVALSVKLGLAKTVAEKDPSRVVELLGQLQAEAQSTLDTLRDIGRGSTPTALLDHGLATALELRARTSPVPVSVEAPGIGRFPEEIEAAAYFCCLEGLQNAAKYARASRAVVTLRHAGGCLSFSVSDDGEGFDPDATPLGAGLRNMAERLEALGGAIEVRSEPGAGTTIGGRIPITRG